MSVNGGVEAIAAIRAGRLKGTTVAVRCLADKTGDPRGAVGRMADRRRAPSR